MMTSVIISRMMTDQDETSQILIWVLRRIEEDFGARGVHDALRTLFPGCCPYDHGMVTEPVHVGGLEVPLDEPTTAADPTVSNGRAVDWSDIWPDWPNGAHPEPGMYYLGYMASPWTCVAFNSRTKVAHMRFGQPNDSHHVNDYSEPWPPERWGALVPPNRPEE